MNTYDPIYATQSNTWQPPRQYGNYQMQPRINTNVEIVTSLEEALIKTTERPSDKVYFHQDKNEFYRIKVDMEGRKSWASFTYNSPNEESNLPATKADIASLLVRIEALEASKNKNKAEVIENVESDGHSTIYTFNTP